MASFNKVILMGNLTHDPEMRAVGTAGMKVAHLRLAVNERRRDKNGQTVEYPVFVDVDVWDRLAELCAQYLTKGKSVLVEGRLQMDSWEKDGVKHQKLKVRAVAVKFLSPSQPQGARPAQAGDGAPASESESDDIPF